MIVLMETEFVMTYEVYIKQERIGKGDTLRHKS